MMPPLSCKVCRASASYLGAVDANRSCVPGPYRPLGRVLLYYRCEGCGFTFTPDLDHLTLADFKVEIYGKSYAEADPEYADGSRARRNVAGVLQVAQKLGALRVLDYGGGDWTLVRLLRSAGVDAESWDVLVDFAPPVGAFGLITAFEVFEHTPTPHETLAEAIRFAAPGAHLFFSTLVSDEVPAGDLIGWWYAAPRNGHISLHTRESMRRLFGAAGWNVKHLSDAVHVAAQGEIRI